MSVFSFNADKRTANNEKEGKGSRTMSCGGTPRKMCTKGSIQCGFVEMMQMDNRVSPLTPWYKSYNSTIHRYMSEKSSLVHNGLTMSILSDR